MHLAGLAQDTLARSLSLVPGLGVRSTRQLMPFQLSARDTVRPAGEKLVPVAMQRSGLAQEMLPRVASVEWVPAAGSTRQLVPFHASASVRRPPAVRWSPTAMQRSGRLQAMAASSLLPRLGVVSTRHRLPFHETASVWLGPALSG